MNILKLARQVFEIESQAIADLSKTLTQEFEEAVHILLACKRQVAVCGIGKSGIIAKKIAATLASTGTSSFFIHPSEAIHGDLGMIQKQDCFLSISYSGETDEILQLIPYIKRLGLKHICIVGNSNSTLAQHADCILNVKIQKEASVLQVVPMASTTATLAMGDALAAVLIHLKKFQREDFALYHPGGSLGLKLLTKVENIMCRQPLPLAKPQSNVQEIIMTMSTGMLGVVAICQENRKVLGIITDGDLRRALNRYTGPLFFELQAKDIMSKFPKTIQAKQSLIEAENVMRTHRITSLLVEEDGFLAGIIAKHHINK